MSGDEIKGRPGEVIDAGFAAPLAITGITNTSPTIVTVGSGHGVMPDDIVRVYGTGIQSLDNLAWWRVGAVTVTTVALHFIDTGDPSAVYGSGSTGFLQNYAWGATIPLTSDLEDRDASSVNVPFEAGADRDSYLLAKLGLIESPYRMIAFRGAVESDTNEDDSTFWTWASTSYANGSGATQLIDTFYCDVNDRLDIDLSILVTIAGGDSARFQIQVDDAAGPSFRVPSGGRFSIAAGETLVRVNVRSSHAIALAGTRIVKVQAKSSGGANVEAIGAGALWIRHWRKGF